MESTCLLYFYYDQAISGRVYGKVEFTTVFPTPNHAYCLQRIINLQFLATHLMQVQLNKRVDVLNAHTQSPYLASAPSQTVSKPWVWFNHFFKGDYLKLHP